MAAAGIGARFIASVSQVIFNLVPKSEPMCSIVPLLRSAVGSACQKQMSP